MEALCPDSIGKVDGCSVSASRLLPAPDLNVAGEFHRAQLPVDGGQNKGHPLFSSTKEACVFFPF